MSSDKPLDDRRKALEEDYFTRQDKEAKARLKTKMELEQMGITDEALRASLMAEGFNADSARVLLFVPLLEVAWADGMVQSEERAAILKFAKLQGIADGSEADRLLRDWLDQGKSAPQFKKAQELLTPFLKTLKDQGQDLFMAAEQVAQAAGGLFGFGVRLVSSEEREVLKSLAERLEKS